LGLVGHFRKTLQVQQMSSRYAQAIDEAEHSPMLDVQGGAVVQDEAEEVQMAKKAKTSPQKGEEEVEAKADDTMKMEKGNPVAEASAGERGRLGVFANSPQTPVFLHIGNSVKARNISSDLRRAFETCVITKVLFL
jgi:hypothetical protein